MSQDLSQLPVKKKEIERKCIVLFLPNIRLFTSDLKGLIQLPKQVGKKETICLLSTYCASKCDSGQNTALKVENC